MTHAVYTYQQLQLKSIARIKQIYSEIGCTVEVSDKRCKDSWITAIAKYQSSKAHKVADNQATAQAELDGFITAQAQAIAPEPLTTVEINSNHYEIYSGKQLIAYIAYDHNEFVTQPWLVMVNGEEKFRDITVARCQRHIEWHHKDGTLNPFALPEVPEVPTISELSFYDQEAFVDRELVASIFYDHENYENLYCRVIINDKEIFRDTTSARCHSYVKQQYQQGTLPVQEAFEEEAEGLLAGGKGEEISPLYTASCSLSSQKIANRHRRTLAWRGQLCRERTWKESPPERRSLSGTLGHMGENILPTLGRSPRDTAGQWRSTASLCLRLSRSGCCGWSDQSYRRVLCSSQSWCNAKAGRCFH